VTSASARRGTRHAEVEREGVTSVPFFTRATDPDGVLVNPTGDPVEVSFARAGARPSTWTTAAWSEGGPFENTPLGEAYECRLTVGGEATDADVKLAPGEWQAYVRPHAGGEAPVIPAGTLTVH
jgi:hypothetical protein